MNRESYKSVYLLARANIISMRDSYKVKLDNAIKKRDNCETYEEILEACTEMIIYKHIIDELEDILY